ncbi:MAG TPA: YceI family protein [Myxococcaceae bacterium]|nr:YceI family protein [Myxococcaceae bacterium]
MHPALNAVAVQLLLVPSVVFASTWEIDSAHSEAVFAVKHMMVSTVRGKLGKVSGTVQIDDKDVTKSTVEAAVDVNGIDTGEPSRDNHLKSPDFFDVAKYPTITFKSTRIKKGAGNQLMVTGDLTMHGVTKPVTLAVTYSPTEAKDPQGHIKRGASATARVNRKDFGLNWNKALETGGVIVGDNIDITLDVELTKKDTPPK